FSSRRRHTRSYGDWSSDVCSSDLIVAEFITYRVALFVYWLNLLLLGFALYASWAYASRAGLLKDAVAEDMSRATRRRILIFQLQIGRASCRERGSTSVGSVACRGW